MWLCGSCQASRHFVETLQKHATPLLFLCCRWAEHSTNCVVKDRLETPASVRRPTKVTGRRECNPTLRPFWVKAEHSRYLTALISLAIWRPCGYVSGWRFFSFSVAIVPASSRRSSLVPTRMIGVLGQWWLTSGYHFARTFSYEAGLINEKQIRKTSVWGYDSGLQTHSFERQPPLGYSRKLRGHNARLAWDADRSRS